MGKTVWMTESEIDKEFPYKKHEQQVYNTNERFRDPVLFQARNKTWKVCHGFATVNGNREWHSWLEKGGTVLDLYFGMNMNAKDYYRVHRVKGVRRYTVAQIRKNLDRYQRYEFLPPV